ncbi:MAG: septum site-determining protein MinC [Lachnospiraceae bacterium]|nr:septum site-determining protein MinC [Lachnospiraceae bacterium]
MKQDSVIIKSNAYGLTLLLNPDIPFEQLLQNTGEKFAQAARFFRNAQMVLTFRGRSLTEEEEMALMEQITANAQIRIVCLVDESKENALRDKDILTQALEENRRDVARLYRGTLRRGERLESDLDIVVLGDVNPGASVISAGEVIVLGCAMGEIWAGATGNEDCYVAALTLLPSTLRIASYTFKSAITKRTDPGDYPINPKMAYIRDGHLVNVPFKASSLEHAAALFAGESEEAAKEAAGETAEKTAEETAEKTFEETAAETDTTEEPSAVMEE